MASTRIGWYCVTAPVLNKAGSITTPHAACTITGCADCCSAGFVTPNENAYASPCSVVRTSVSSRLAAPPSPP
eukprot:932420-Rhodomonas_salina.4